MKFNKFDGSYSCWVPYFCVGCKNLGKHKEGVPTCNAYPSGIPVKVWRNENPLNNLCEGGNGYHYEDAEFNESKLEGFELMIDE